MTNKIIAFDIDQNKDVVYFFTDSEYHYFLKLTDTNKITYNHINKIANKVKTSTFYYKDNVLYVKCKYYNSYKKYLRSKKIKKIIKYYE